MTRRERLAGWMRVATLRDSPPGFVVSAVAWTFLVLVVLALAAASVWRRRTPPAPPRLAPPRTDDLGSLGLSPARPVGAAPVPASTTATAAPAVALPAGEDDEPGWTYDTSLATTHVEADAPDIGEPPAANAERGSDARPAADAPLAEPVLDTAAHEADALADDAPADDAPGPSGDGVAARPALASPLTAPAAPTFVAPASPLWVAPGPPEHLLASLASCIGGTVAVLRRDADGYHVDALAGLPTAAAPAPLAGDAAYPLDRAPLDRVLSILDGDDLAALTYLPDGSARTALVRALDETPEPRVLVAVTLGVDADHVDADTARLIGDYVNLLAALRADDAAPPDDEWSDDDGADDEPAPTAVADGETPGASANPEPPDELADESVGDETDLDPEVPAFEPSHDAAPRRAPDALPRSVILAGEMAAARAARRPLAFALVTRADAEALLTDDARASTAEADLADLLRGAPRVRRVESFGPLLLAVFLDADADQVPVWARSLGGPPVHVGAVAPAAGDPEAVRRAAAHALERAYAEGAVCQLAD